eukprot:11084614-Alexandrium_andersonii.AAC.1
MQNTNAHLSQSSQPDPLPLDDASTVLHAASEATASVGGTASTAKAPTIDRSAAKHVCASRAMVLTMQRLKSLHDLLLEPDTNFAIAFVQARIDDDAPLVQFVNAGSDELTDVWVTAFKYYSLR